MAFASSDGAKAVGVDASDLFLYEVVISSGKGLLAVKL